MNHTSVGRPSLADPLLTSSNHHNRELIQQYLAWKESHTTAAYRTYRIWVSRFQEFVNKPPEQLSHLDYAAFANQLRERYASKCIEFALNVVHNYLRFFAEQGRLRFPMYLVRVPRGFSKPHEAISEEEYRSIVAALRKATPLPLRDLAIIMLLHDTGMRIGELLSLEVDDIEEDRSAVIRTEKTTRSRRVFWNPATDQVLQQYLVKRINMSAALGPTELLFPAQNGSGKSLASRTIQRMFKCALKRANIARKLCLHSFRHAFIHRLAKLGVPDAIIAQLVGHSTPETIAHYTKLSRPELRDYAERQLDFVAG